MSTARVLELSCPVCGRELLGLEADVLFCCGNCAIAYDPRDRKRHPLERLSTPADHEPHVLLPMWAFPASLRVLSGSGEAVAMAERVKQTVKTLYVSAFALVREEYYGEPGLVWTRRQDTLQTLPRSPGEPLAVVGLRRGEEVARRYAEPYYLQLVDEQADITGIELQVSVDGPGRILVVPFRDQGTHVMDPVTGLGYPCRAIEDMNGIRAAMASLAGGGKSAAL